MSIVAEHGAAKLSPDQLAEFIADPLKQLPAEFRLPTWDFWAFFSDVLKADQLSLCTRIRWWIGNDGLKLDELVRAFDELRRPQASSSLRFASEVLSGIADAVERHRTELLDAERKRREFEAVKGNTAGERVQTNLSELFRMPARKESP